MVALADDDELAENILSRQGSEEEGPRRRPPSLLEWSLQTELLAGLYEAVQRLTSITIAANSDKGNAPKVTPLPRPVTAMDRLRRKREQEQLAAVVEMIRPK